jgi:hypothetical protein
MNYKIKDKRLFLIIYLSITIAYNQNFVKDWIVDDVISS